MTTHTLDSHARAFVHAANLAGDDPARALAVVEMIRAAGVALGVTPPVDDAPDVDLPR